MLHERAARRAEATTEQLHGALNSRVVIEQAKGVLAHQGGIAPADAFAILRTYARNHGLRLTDLCRAIVEGNCDLAAIVDTIR